MSTLDEMEQVGGYVNHMGESVTVYLTEGHKASPVIVDALCKSAIRMKASFKMESLGGWIVIYTRNRS